MFKFSAAIQYATEVGVSGCWLVEENVQQKMGVSVPKPSLIHDSLSNRDLKSCNDWWWCISSPQISVSLPVWREADSNLQGSAVLWEPSWEDVPLPFSQELNAARARVTISSASTLLMSSLAALVFLTSELSWRLLKFSGVCFWAAVYILWFVGETRDLACVPVSALQNKPRP